MNERQGISIAVLSENQDDVELVTGTLRTAGHAAHCDWIKNPKQFDTALESAGVELIILNSDNYIDSIAQVIKQKEPYAPEVPVIAIANTVDESKILAAMHDGAYDLVSIDNKARLQSVVNRELRAFRVERALNSTLNSASEYRRLLDDYMQGSANAIAYVQEGIVVEVNNSWLTMFQVGNKEEALGLPLMDSFLNESQAAIKGALVATTKGKWRRDEKLSANLRTSEGDNNSVEMQFQATEFDDGPCVQISIEPPQAVPEVSTKLVQNALKRDPTTLFLLRKQFLGRMTKRLARKPKSGTHVLVYIKPDSFSEVGKKVGILETEEVLAQFAEEIRKKMHPRDIAGRFEGTVILALLERGSDRDAEVWGQQLVDHINKHEFQIGEQNIRLTCTIGVVGVSGVFSNLDEFVTATAAAHSEGKSQGGNTVYLSESNDADTRLRKYDAIWVKYIKSALIDNRFRLAQQPIAGLRSDSEKMYDMLVRMIDEQGNAVLPSEFLPAAERNNLMKAIDRWIIVASINFCATNDAGRIFVRLSRQSIQDSSLVDWLKNEFSNHKLDPKHLCVQLPEQEAATYIKETKKATEEFRQLGIGLALEHYGVEKNRSQILDILKPDYIKLDGELMHSLMTDTEMQKSVEKVMLAATERNIETIAERVENANAMAVLFQLGVNYMQGHYVHEPEVVLQESTGVARTTLAAIGGS